MLSIKPNKHDRYVQELVQRIKPDYDDISTHLELKRKRRVIAEVDVVARKGDTYHLFEVKCSYRITKARKQLHRAQHLFGNEKTVCFFYCGMGKSLVEL